MRKQKLELTWIGKDERPRLEPRILLEDTELSYHAKTRREGDIFDNRLIFGDNLLALKALEHEFSGQVKCVYIDPPFNTGGAFEHYDDALEHSLWLTLMRDRLEILCRLLSPDGAIVVNLDDTEAAYCKIILDEVFGRSNYIGTIVVEAATPSSFKTVNTGPTEVAQYLFLYAKNKSKFQYIPQYQMSREVDLQHFSRFILNPNSEPSEWQFQSINDHILAEMGFEGATPNAKWSAARSALGAEEARRRVKVAATEFALQNADRVFETKTLQKPSRWLEEHILDSRGTDTVIKLEREVLEPIYLYNGRQLYFLSKGVREVGGKRYTVKPLSTIWTDIPTNNLQREGGVEFPAGKKPEQLIKRVIGMISGNEGDIILDSFGGSGTTAAVAHKMKRRWITVELRQQAETHIRPRLQAVIDGKDSTGVSLETGWKGGGGFRFYRLAPTLILKDTFGNDIINPDYNPEMLSEAVCKFLGFRYEPSEDHYWMHGQSTEADFIFVTTQPMTQAHLQYLSDEVGPERSLLVCCMAFKGKADAWPNLTLKRIPKEVLGKCEFGRDDYSLKIANLPERAVVPGSLFEDEDLGVSVQAASASEGQNEEGDDE